MLRSIVPLFALAFVASAPPIAAQTIPIQQFRSVRLVAGGEVYLVRGPVQRVTMLNGSTDLTRFEMGRDQELQISTSCKARCPHKYGLRIEIQSPTVPDVAVYAGGSIIARPGFVPQNQISAAVEAGGTIDLRALQADYVSAAVHAGGEIYVHPRRTLSAAVHAGGDIRYTGNPRVSMAVSGGGDVRNGY